MTRRVCHYEPLLFTSRHSTTRNSTPNGKSTNSSRLIIGVVASLLFYTILATLCECQRVTMTPVMACDDDYKNGTCLCHLADGSGKIDLRQLAEQSEKTPIISSTGFFTYYLTLCGKMKNPQFQGCNQAASMCETRTRPLPYSLNIGDPATTRFEYRTYKKATNNYYAPPRLALVLESTQQSNARSLIFLICDEKQRHVVLNARGYESERDPDNYLLYYAELRGAALCPNAEVELLEEGLSNVAIIFITRDMYVTGAGHTTHDHIQNQAIIMMLFYEITITPGFFALVFAYFVGGFLVMTFFYKHAGLQRIPNYSFWHDVVYEKLKDCFGKVFNRFRPQNRYDQFDGDGQINYDGAEATDGSAYNRE